MRGFLVQMKSVVDKCSCTLKSGKFCAILMGDTRKKGVLSYVVLIE
jgi:hypothetical protein